MPPQIAEIPEARAEFELAMQESIAHYQKIAELLKSQQQERQVENDNKDTDWLQRQLI